jgi:hypothetical protein
MVGEACRQISDSDSSTLQNVLFTSALVVQEGSSDVEMMTSLRPSKLTNTRDSAWFDFAISSFRLKRDMGDELFGTSKSGREIPPTARAAPI